MKVSRESWLWVAAIAGVTFTGLGLFLGYLEWRRHVRQARHTELQASLRVPDQEAWLDIEREQGFSRSTTLEYPQVGVPADAEYPGVESWVVTAVRPTRPESFDGTGKGVVLRWSEETGLALSPAQLDLAPTYRAERPEDVEWLLFTHLRQIEDAYTFAGRSVYIERLDARLVTLDGRLLARATAESSPPFSRDRSSHRRGYRIPVEFVAEIVARLSAEVSLVPAGEDVVSAPPTCIRDQIPTNFPVHFVVSEGCERQVAELCRAECNLGNGRACAQAGYVVENGDDGRARDLYRRGCLAGDVNACTNWGASVVRHYREDAELLACSQQVFQLTCEHGEHFGCGMYGSGLLDVSGEEQADNPEARDFLERTCEEHGMFPCDVLGVARRRGQLGEDQTHRAQEAFRRSCETGYQPACEEVDEAVAESPDGRGQESEVAVTVGGLAGP